MMFVRSLKRQLFLRVSILIFVTLVAVSAFAFRSVHNSIAEDYDAQLVTDANVLWLLTKEDLEESEHHKFVDVDVSSIMSLQPGIYESSLELYGNWHAFRVWKDNQIMLRSDNAEGKELPIVSEGLSTILIQGKEWRVYSLHIVKNKAVVEAFENLDSRKMVEKEILLGLLGSLVLLIPLIGIMLAYGINGGLLGLKRFAQQVENRSAEDLTSIESSSAPDELRPLMAAINGLFAKLRAAIQRERELIDNAAHALFTPLSALKVQMELLEECKDKREQTNTIVDVKAGINRTTKLIQQLLFLSRLNHQIVHSSAINLYTTVQNALADISALAFDKKIKLSLDGDDAIIVNAERELLSTLIRTIIENAIKYTPVNGTVKLNIHQNSHLAILEVEDNGIGISEFERENVFERFYRGQSTAQQGSGLGLAIAKSIADILGATIAIETPLNGIGTRIKISFVNK